MFESSQKQQRFESLPNLDGPAAVFVLFTFVDSLRVSEVGSGKTLSQGKIEQVCASSRKSRARPKESRAVAVSPLPPLAFFSPNPRWSQKPLPTKNFESSTRRSIASRTRSLRLKQIYERIRSR